MSGVSGVSGVSGGFPVFPSLLPTLFVSLLFLLHGCVVPTQLQAVVWMLVLQAMVDISRARELCGDSRCRLHNEVEQQARHIEARVHQHGTGQQ